MTSTTKPLLAETLTIGALAKKVGVPRTTLWRRLLRLFKSTGGTWLVRRGHHWVVNVEALRKAAPEFAHAPTQDERLEDHEDRLLALERLSLQLVEERAGVVETSDD